MGNFYGKHVKTFIVKVLDKDKKAGYNEQLPNI